MPENVRFGNNLFERKCSNCKRMQEPQYYEHRIIVYRTCNNCRFKAYQRSHPLNTSADFNRGTARIVHVGQYTDTDSNYSEQPIMQEYNSVLVSMSPSAAACSESYFGSEPEPEPEP